MLRPYDRHLLLPVYEVRQAAHLTGVTPQRVSSWHRGYGDRSTAPPLIRTNRAKRQRLNYLQLVEVAVAVHAGGHITNRSSFEELLGGPGVAVGRAHGGGSATDQRDDGNEKRGRRRRTADALPGKYR